MRVTKDEKRIASLRKTKNVKPVIGFAAFTKPDYDEVKDESHTEITEITEIDSLLRETHCRVSVTDLDCI